MLSTACSNTRSATLHYLELDTQVVSSPASTGCTVVSCDLLSLLLQSEPTRWISVMLTMHTSNVQPSIVLDGFRCPSSACPETGWTESIDLSPNIDLESRSGASALETPVCYQWCTRGRCELCGDESATSGYLRPWGATTGQIMARGGSPGPVGLV